MAETRPSIGEQLRQARESRNLSIEKVSQETHIRLGYIRALEDGDLEILPSAAQARGFMRAYARYLDLDFDGLLAAPLQDAPKSADGDDDRPDGPSLLSPLDGESPQTIYAEIGRCLAEQRSLLGFSLEDVERQTHIKARYLKSLETGRIDELPSPVQGRGMLNNYAAFIGLDPDPLLLRFADGLQAGLATRRSRSPTQPRRSATPSASPLRRVISGDMLLGGVLIVSLAIFFIWGIGRVTNLSNQEEPPQTELSLGGLLLGSPTQESTQPAETPVPDATTEETLLEETGETPGPLIPPELEGAVQVYVIVHQSAWLRVLVDGDEEFAGRVLEGAALPFSGEESVEVLTGNGLALEVVHNQTNLGRLGFFGEVVHRVFTAEGIFTPTPTNSPTPTATPPATATPTPGDVLPTE